MSKAIKLWFRSSRLPFISGKFGFDSDDRHVAVSSHFSCTVMSTITKHTDSVKLSQL